MKKLFLLLFLFPSLLHAGEIHSVLITYLGSGKLEILAYGINDDGSPKKIITSRAADISALSNIRTDPYFNLTKSTQRIWIYFNSTDSFRDGVQIDTQGEPRNIGIHENGTGFDAKTFNGSLPDGIKTKLKNLRNSIRDA